MTARLTPAELAQAKLYATGEWALLSRDSLSGVEVWVKREGNHLRVRETQRIDPILDANKANANDWTSWRDPKNKFGAVVARIPVATYNDLRRKSGWDGSDYDKKKFRRLLNDSDNASLRTGGGTL